MAEIERISAARDREDLKADRSARRHLNAYRLLAGLMDQAFRVPGTRFRFGLDPLIGLIPVAGDFAGSALGFYGIWAAAKLGAPASIQLRMAANLILDDLIGSVPFIGDLIDFGFKAHTRNIALLERWEQSPGRTSRGSTLLLVVIALAMLAAFAGIIAIGVWLAAALWHAGHSTGA